MRCVRHGLAAGPDGRCTLCRRDDAAPARMPSWVFWLAGATIAALGIFAGVRLLLSPKAAAPSTIVAAGPTSMPFSASRAPSALPSVAPLASLLPPDPSSPGSPEGLAEENRKVARERKRVSVTIYETSWCPYCKATRAWLTNHDQPFFERDVEQDPDAKLRAAKLNPKGGVPTIVVDDQVITGFDAATLDHAIDTAARKRVQEER